MIIAVFWDVAAFDPCANQHFRGTCHPHLHCWKSAEQETTVLEVSRWKMEVIHSSEMSVNVQTTWHCIPEDGDIDFSLSVEC
jgi:hypothetical protein